MNPRQMQKAMKQMGIHQEEIDASEVIIKTGSGNLVVRNPSVVKIKMQGQMSFQISGDVSEESVISEDDIKTVAEQAGVSEEKARESLEKHDGDLAEAILSLQG